MFPRTAGLVFFLIDIHRHLWELSHGDSFSIGGSQVIMTTTASCFSLEGKLERSFSKLLSKERVTQHYSDPSKRFSSLPSRELAVMAQGHIIRPPHHHPHKHLNECNVWLQYPALFPLLWIFGFHAYLRGFLQVSSRSIPWLNFDLRDQSSQTVMNHKGHYVTDGIKEKIITNILWVSNCSPLCDLLATLNP